MTLSLGAVTGDALLSAFAVAASTVPLVHVICLRRLTPNHIVRRRLNIEAAFLREGGSRALVLQALSLALWLFSLLVAVPVLAARWRQQHGTVHMELLSAAAAVVAHCSLLFQVKALLVFDPAAPLHSLLGGAFARGRERLAWDVGRLPSRTARAYIVTGIGLLWVGLGGALLLATEFLHDPVSLAVYYSLAAACVTTGAFTTHGLAGFLRFADPPDASSHGGGGGSPGASGTSSSGGGSTSSSGWRFFQPFQGGTAFVLAQALGWALYSSALAALIHLVIQAVAGVAYCVRCWAVAAGVVMFTSELLLAGSLLTFRGGSVIAAAKHMAEAPAIGGLAGLRARLLDAVVISMLYVPMHIFCAVAAVTFMVLPSAHAAALWLGGLFVYYSVTAFGQPEHTGRREWPALQTWLGEQLERFLPQWLGSLQVVLDGGKETAQRFDPQGRYVFGFVHHGLYPLGAGYLPLLPSFRRLVPVRPVTLTASVTVTVPLLRDIVLWLGVRVVSRRTFEHTLRERRAVLICPGGQAEMCLTQRLHRHKQFTVYSGHKGFVRIALQQGASLVPVLALGEADSLHNMIEWPSVQRWCTKKLGFPIPFVIAGRWFLPLPAPTHLKYVVGAPIPPPTLQHEGQPSAAEVDAFHARYYEALQQLWKAHAADFPGYQNVTLVVA